MEPVAPVRWHAALGSGSGVVRRVTGRRREPRPVEGALTNVVPVPVLAGLEALDERMAAAGCVAAGVLGRRGIAAPDMSAGRAASKVEPPPVLGGQALHAAGPTRRLAGV